MEYKEFERNNNNPDTLDLRDIQLAAIRFLVRAGFVLPYHMAHPIEVAESIGWRYS